MNQLVPQFQIKKQQPGEKKKLNYKTANRLYSLDEKHPEMLSQFLSLMKISHLAIMASGLPPPKAQPVFGITALPFFLVRYGNILIKVRISY